MIGHSIIPFYRIITAFIYCKFTFFYQGSGKFNIYNWGYIKKPSQNWEGLIDCLLKTTYEKIIF